MLINKYLLLLPLAGLFPAFLSAQDVEFLFAGYNHSVFQTGRGTSVPNYYNFYTGTYTGEVQVITDLKVTGPSTPPEGEPIPWDIDDFEWRLYLDTQGDMTTDVVPGTYTFSGTIGGNPFTEDLALPA
ncbi:MAG: hypothetical protein ACO3ZW_08145 [Opitutales bacterium]|jgi:hypothetical protein